MKFLNVSSKTENKVLKESIASRSYVSPPGSPLIDRRPLSPRTEAELKAACYALVHDYSSPKPSRRAREADIKPTVDFEALHQTMKARRAEAQASTADRPARTSSRQPDVYKPTAGPIQVHHSQRIRDPLLRQLTGEHDPIDPAVQANTGRGRDHTSREIARLPDPTARAASSHTHRESTNYSRNHYNHNHHHQTRPQTAPIDSPETDYSTPHTASTGEHPMNHVSTTVTSVAITPSKPSKRVSRQGYHDEHDEISRTDAAAQEWMRKELEKRRRSQSLMQEVTSPTSSNGRSRSKTRSIAADIKEYIRPRTSGGVRPASRDSLRSKPSQDGLERASSSHGWRSWSLQRKPSSTNVGGSRKSSLGSSTEEGRGRSKGKKEVNLNRELPPLPALDSYAQHKAGSNTHIADLALLTSPSKKRHSASRSFDATSPLSPTRGLKEPFDMNGRSVSSMSSKAFPNQNAFSKQANGTIASPMSLPLTDHYDFHNHIVNAMDLSHTLDSSSYQTESEAHKRSGSDTRPPTNFSRKISMEPGTRARTYDPQHPNILQTTPLQSPTAESEKSKTIKKMMSSMFGKKKENKQMTWMDRVEKSGIKGGIMIHDEAAGALIIRY